MSGFVNLGLKGEGEGQIKATRTQIGIWPIRRLIMMQSSFKYSYSGVEI